MLPQKQAFKRMDIIYLIKTEQQTIRTAKELDKKQLVQPNFTNTQ
jgi:hypothetical protein